MEPIKINNYYLGKKIGKGTFGEVSVCFDQTNAERRVIKKIRKERRFIEYSKKEIKILNILKDNTANIIELIDDFMYENIQYLVFEYMETNLYQYYKNNIIKYNDVIHIMYEVIKGLDFIHQNKIIHCDLKPENIMLNTSGSKIVKIIDFGSSKLDEERKNHFYIASRYYRAPELAFEIYFNNSIDIWSYGCIFFEILFRKPLFAARNKNDLIYLFTTLIGIPKSGRYFTCNSYRQYFIWNEGLLKSTSI